MPIQLRSQRNLPQKPLNKHPMSPTIPIAKLRLLKELNLQDNHNQQNSLTRNSTMYNLNNYGGGGSIWSQRNAMYDPRYSQFGQQTGLSRYSSSLPNSPSKRPIHNYYNQHLTQQLNHQMTPRHLSSIPNYQPLDCYTVGANGVLSAHGPRFPLGTLPPLNSTSPHSPQTNLSLPRDYLPSHSQITRPPFLDGQYSHRTGLYNPLLYDKTLQRLKQRIPVCKSAPLSSIVANSLPSTNQFNTHDAVTGLPRRRHTTASALTKSSLSPKMVNLGTGHRNPSTLLDGTIEQEDSPLTAMRKEIKYFVDERKRQLEQGALDINNLNTLTVPNTVAGKYLGSNSNLSNSTAIFNDQSPLSGTHLQTSPNLASTLAQNRYNYLSSSESDLNALLHMYSYPPDPVLERQVQAGASVYQRLPQYYLNRSKHRYTVDDLRRHRNPLLDYYDENLFNQYYGNGYNDPLLDRNQLLPTSTYNSLIDWPTSYGQYNRPGYYASTGCLRQLQTPTLTNLNSLNSAGLNALNYNRGLLSGANRNLYDQDLLSDNYLPSDYAHHYSLDTLGLDHRTSYSRPSSPYYGTSAMAPMPDYTQHSLSTNHLDLLPVDLNNNSLLSKPLGQTTSSLPLRSYRI